MTRGPSLFCHRIGRVQEDIHEHLLDLISVDEKLGTSGSKLFSDLNIVEGSLILNERERLIQENMDIP